MPTVLRVHGYRFFFFSNEGNEPIHIHVEKGGGTGKVWIDPAVRTEYFYGFTVREKREIMDIIENNEGTIREAWNERFK